MAAFGAELRRLRMAARLSLAQLSKEVHYSKPHLSRIETGQKQPSLDLARACDTALHADGRLSALVPAPGTPLASPTRHRSAAPTEDPLDEPSWASATNVVDDLMTIKAFEEQFGQLRRMGNTVGSGLIVQTVLQQARILDDAALRPGEHRERVLLLAARYYEYAGWMYQESGADHEAAKLTNRAVRLANAGGDALMAIHALLRMSLMALYANQSRRVIDLSTRAYQTPGAPAWLKGLAFAREAQGQALAGDYAAARRALDHAAELPRRQEKGAVSLQLGSTAVPDSVAMTTGWCLSDLGRTALAAEILDREVARLPAEARRARARFGMRGALAHALNGELNRACEVAYGVLPDAMAIRSATVLHDVKRLSSTMDRWQRHQPVRELLPHLAAIMGATAAATATG